MSSLSLEQSELEKRVCIQRLKQSEDWDFIVDKFIVDPKVESAKLKKAFMNWKR